MNLIYNQRLLSALAGTSDVLDELLGSLIASDPRWDFRPDPDRFTLREVVAHLTDYNGIWLDRFVRARIENHVVLERGDPGKLAIDHDYEHSDPVENMKLFRSGRIVIVDLLSSFTDNDWALECTMPQPIGATTLEYQAGFLTVHDGYHTGQIAQWLALARARTQS